MTRTLLIVAFLLTVFPVEAARQDTVSTARELYATAAYEEALAMLDRLRTAGPAPDEARTVEQFRAYCLFALNRTTEAEEAIAAAVALDPAWEIGEREAPPRIVALFASVRARVVPELIRQRFTAAKTLYAEKKHDKAVEAFTSLIALLDHPSIAKVASPDLADLKTVASGFRDLARAASELAARAAAPPPAPAPSAPVDRAASNSAPDPSASRSAPASSGTARPAPQPVQEEPILPPGIITQQIPRPMSMAVPIAGEAVVVMDVLIDESGRVERAIIRQSANRAYEAQLLAASRAWRYTPATQSGKPVKYVKTLEITLTPR